MSIPSVAVAELSNDAVLLDVRQPGEWAYGHTPGAVHIPMGELLERLAELPETDGPLPIICRSGARSARVVAYLVANGTDAVNVDGGMLDWAQAGKPMVGGNGSPVVL